MEHDGRRLLTVGQPAMLMRRCWRAVPERWAPGEPEAEKVCYSHYHLCIVDMLVMIVGAGGRAAEQVRARVFVGEKKL
eukprot:3254337-Rhodomonas_salina.1